MRPPLYPKLKRDASNKKENMIHVTMACMKMVFETPKDTYSTKGEHLMPLNNGKTIFVDYDFIMIMLPLVALVKWNIRMRWHCM